jgi:hypothetical protein
MTKEVDICAQCGHCHKTGLKREMMFGEFGWACNQKHFDILRYMGGAQLLQTQVPIMPIE